MKIHFDFNVDQFLSDIGKLNLEEKLLWKPGRQRDPVSGSCSGAVAIGLLSWAASTQYFDVLVKKRIKKTRATDGVEPSPPEKNRECYPLTQDIAPLIQ